jgi:hypothetical protein
MKYYVVQDSIYSHVTTEKPNWDQKFEEYETFTKAKNALIEELHDMYDEYRYALQKARSLKKSDFTEKRLPEFHASFKIIESKRLSEAPHSIVLAYSKELSSHVTWLFNHRDGGFHWGHYFGNNYDKAKEDFENRD